MGDDGDTATLRAPCVAQMEGATIAGRGKGKRHACLLPAWLA